MGNKATDQKNRQNLRHRLRSQGMTEVEIERRVEYMKREQRINRAVALPVHRNAPSLTADALTSVVVEVVVRAREVLRDETPGSRERLQVAVDAFDGWL